jgi:protein-S-isoprenylcysteine O-methyltransferase Ste14
MKERIKIDSTLLSFIIIMTGILFLCPYFYPSRSLWEDVFDFLGVVAIFKGVFIRMAARGHKKAHSLKSEQLVTSGPYSLVRNPMYLGSFLIGAGFILMLWPWWALPVFAGIFYARFNPQMVKEEEFLTKLAGEKYVSYCRETPRIFPSWARYRGTGVKNIFNIREAFSTKEKRGLWTWPLLAFVLESVQERLVFGDTVFLRTAGIFAAAAGVYAVGIWFWYVKK